MNLRRPTSEQRRKVWERSKGICGYCKAEIKFKTFHVDHRIPFCAGGRTVLRNLLASCRRCNIAKGVRTEEQFRVLLGIGGIEWRDREYWRVMQTFTGSRQRTRGVSNPAIGLRKRQQAIARKTNRALQAEA